MHCPSCLESLKREAFSGQTVDRCEKCDGLWLDNSELSALVRVVPVTSKEFAEAQLDRRELACPKCQAIMNRINYAHDSGVFIQRCSPCDGVWLGVGQLERIVSYRSSTPSVRRLGDAFSEELSASKRVSLASKLLRSRTASAIVAVIWFAILASPAGDALVPFFRKKNAYLMCSAFGDFLALACIWFPESVCDFLRVNRRADQNYMPPDLLAFMGWLLLLAPMIGALIFLIAF